MVPSFKSIEECRFASKALGIAPWAEVYLRIASASRLSNSFTKADFISTRLLRWFHPDVTIDAPWMPEKCALYISHLGSRLGVAYLSNIEESSHTLQGAYGYLLSQINPNPRLSVLAHFPVADDTVECALQSVQNHFPPEGYPVLGTDIV
jgi:hypothetical protein